MRWGIRLRTGAKTRKSIIDAKGARRILECRRVLFRPGAQILFDCRNLRACAKKWRRQVRRRGVFASLRRALTPPRSSSHKALRSDHPARKPSDHLVEPVVSSLTLWPEDLPADLPTPRRSNQTSPPGGETVRSSRRKALRSMQVQVRKLFTAHTNIRT